MVFTTPPPGVNTNKKITDNKQKSPSQTSSMKIAEDLESINRRLRILEERYTNLRHKTQLTDQNMIHNNQKFHRMLELNNEEISEVKHEINEIKNKLSILIKELKLLAKKEDVDVLKKYVDMWEPVEFVTINQVERIVDEILTEKLKQKQYEE